MASFLHQLKVLLWKNWLSVYRQPVWSVVLIFWPVVIFIILAITRTKYPPTLASDCYLAPRNLQSTGMIPFLQNFLCDTDTRCLNRSYISSTTTASTSTSRRLRKRSVDSGGGGSLFQMKSSSTLWDRTAGETVFSDLSVIKASLEELASGNVKGSLCAITPLLPTTQQATFQKFCSSDQPLTTFAAQAIFSLFAQSNSTDIITTIGNISTQIYYVQNNTALWNTLLMLPEWIKNPSLILEADFLLQFSPEIADLQSCVKNIVNQALNQSWTNTSLGILKSELQSCKSFLQNIPYASSQYKLGMEQTLQTMSWLMSSLTNGTSNNICEFNGLNITCNGTYNLDAFLQSVMTIVNETSSNSSSVIRYLQRTWSLLKQNRVDEMILQLLEQTNSTTSSSDPQMQRVFTQLFNLLFNATDLLIAESNMGQYAGVLQPLLDQMNALIGTELLNMESLNSTSTVTNLTQSIVKDLQYLSGFLSTSNMSSQSLVEVQTLIGSLSSINSDISSLNSTTLSQSVTIINQLFNGLQTLQTLLNANPVASSLAKIILQDMMATSSLNSSELVNLCVKEILTFLNTDVALINNLAFLNSYLNNTQLEFLQSEAFTSYAGDILNFLTPSNLQDISSKPNNVTLALLKLISGFIPSQEKETFHKVESIFTNLLDFISSCQTELSSCTSSIVVFQQQLSDMMQYINDLKSGNIQAIIGKDIMFVNFSKAEIAIVNTVLQMITCSQTQGNVTCKTTQDFYNTILGQVSSVINITLGTDSNLASIHPMLDQIKDNVDNIIQVLGSVDLTNLTSQLDNIAILSKCYRNATNNPVQCTMELSLSLMDYLQILPFPQPVHDTLLVASSIVKNWLGAVDGKTEMYQQLAYLHNVSSMAFYNQSTLMEIHRDFLYIVQWLDELSMTSVATETLIKDLLETLPLANITYTFPSSLLLQTSQGLQMVKTQLQTIEWYIEFVKNETNAFQTTGNIDVLVTMAQEIIRNVLSSVRSNPSLVPIADEILNVMNWLQKSHIIPVLQSVLNETLQNGGQSLEAFISHTVSAIEMIIQQEVVNGTLWTSSLNEITEGDVTFVVQLLQKYDNEQLANLSSVLLLTEKVIVTVESLVMDLQAVYNISQEVISILYNAEHNSSITKNIFYDIYSLLLEGWNGEIFKEFPMLKKRMRDLLYISMECLSENVDSSPPQNCSFEDIINVTKLMILELTNQTNIDFSTTEGNVTMNSFLEFVLNAIQQENVVNITNSKISITEELACLTKSLNISLQLVSRVNNHLGLNTSWIPEMDKALVKMTEKFSAFNFTCPTIDSKMANIMYQLAQNHTNFLQSLFPLVSDLTSIPSQYVKYTDQMFNIIKLYDAAQGQVNLNKTLVNLWNETLLQLFETNPNSSEWILASEILNILSNLSTYTGSDELKELSVILNRVADLTAAGLHLNTSLSNFSIFKIFESNFSTLIYNLMKLETSALNMTSTEKCEHTLITLLTFYQSNMNITLSQPVYANFSAWTCNMVFSNISDSDWLDVIMSLDSGAQKNATIKIISSFIQFITFPNMDSFEKFVTSVTERFFGKEPQSNFIVLQSLQDLIISLQSLVAQVMSSDNTNSGSTLENISIHVVEAVQVFLQSLNITGHNEIFAFASDMVHVYFDFRNSAMSLENLAQKILGQILTSFQESGLQNVFVQSVESQILSLPSAEQQVVHSFLLNVVSAINKTISEIARQPPSYNNNLVFNIIENIVKNFNRTYAMENLGGNKVITELIFSLVTDILQLAQNWNNISLAIAFPQNGSNSAVNELEGLLNTLLSLDAVDKDLYYNYSTALLKVFTAFFAKGEKDQVMQTIQYLLNFSNGTINVPVLVNALENFYDLLNLNKTLDLNILDLYIKQLSSFIANSQMIQDFSELSYLFNTSQKLFSGQSNEIRSAALELLPFFSPTSLYNISKDSDSFVSTLLNVMSKDLPLDQQLTIRNFTDTVLSLIKLIEKCSNDSIACDSAISDFQVLAINLVEVFTTIGNGTLNLKISNETLVELEKLSSLQISLINNIFSLLWSLQNTTDDMSGDLQNIFQDILSASQLILNITKELNAAQSDLEILKNYTQLMVTIEKVASANNVTATLLQILNLWKDFQCTNQNLLCMVNLTSHFLEFLQTLKVPKPLMGQVLAASSITKYWMSEINATADVYQQIVSLYELTRTTLQSEPTLQTILQTIMDISKIIQDMKIDNTSFSTVEDLILNIFKTLQDGDLLNSTASLPHINSTQFEKVQTEVKIIEWYIMYIKNMTENQNISGDPYVLYRLIQISLMDVMAGVHNWVEVWNRSNFSSHEIENLLQLLTRNETEAMGQLWLHLSDILQHMNSSQGLNTAEFTTILQIINGLLAGEMNVTQIDDIVKVLQTAIMTHNITEGAELFQLYNLILEVLNQTYSNGNMNLTQYFQSLLESFLAMDCQDVSRTFTHIYKFILNTTNLKNPWVDEMFISNFTLEVCRLLHWNNSQNDWFTLLQISQGLISYAIPLVPDSMSKYLTASEYILQVASEILAEPDVTQKNIMNILNVVPVISELFNISVMDWGQNGIFQKLAYFLLDLAWTSSSPKDVLLLKLQNFALTMAQDIQDILKAQPPSLHKAWMSFALEVVENFMNGTQDGSSEDRLLKQVWNSFRQSGLENAILSEFSDLVLHNSYASSENAQLLKDLLQLVFNITDSVISEAPLTTNTTINVLQMALSSILQTVLTQYKNVTMELSGLQTGMDMAMIFHDLQLLLDSMQIPTNASNIEASLFSLISKYVQIFLSNDTQHMKLLLDAEKIFNEFAQMNTTISIQELSAILANYLPLAGSNNETQASLYTILNMWQYLNNLTGAQSNDLSNITVQMLPIIQSILHKSSNVSELMSWLVNIISDHIPISEQEGFHQVANATQLLIDAVQTCSVTTMTCPGLAEEIQNFVLDVSQLEAFTQNRSLANGSLLHFGRYNESQISLINKIFLLLSCAMGYPSNASLSQGGVYEDVLSLQDWIFNTTMEESLNFTTNFSPQTIKEILNSVNITKFILQVENVLQASKCANYSDKDELLCKLNATLQLTWLLNQLPIGHTIHGNLSVISSILGRWISNFNTEISIYQQLIDLHNVTVLTLQYQPILQALNTSLVNIVHVLHDFGILQNISMIETDIVTNILSGIIQQLEFGPNISNHSSVLHYNVSDLLESMQLEFGIVNWLLLHLENQTGLFANSSGATMIKWMMTNYQQIAIIVRDVESVVNSFDQLSPNATIDAVKMLLEDLLMTYLPQTEDGQLIKTLETVINVTRILLEVTGPDMINQIHKFINNFITLQSDISNDPTKLLDLLSAMNQTGLISEIGQFIKSFSVSNDMQFLQQFLDVLNIFNNFAQKNKSINVQELSAILVKYLQLSSETASDVQHSLNVIFNLWGYLNNVTNGQSSNLSNMTIQLLPLLESHLLLNENTNISEIMSWVVYTISRHVPPEELDMFEKAANASLVVIEALETCVGNSVTCVDLNKAVQNFMANVVQLETLVHNRTLANCTLLQLTSYNQSQIVLINDLFLMLSYAMGQSSNTSTSHNGVYEDIFTLLNMVLNTTMEKELNITIPLHLQGLSEVLMSANISQVLLQVQTLLSTSICTNRTDMEPFLCKLNMILQVTQFLSQLPLPQPTHDNILVISTMVKDWLSHLDNMSTYQQLLELYNVTVLAFDQQFTLEAINTSLVNIMYTLHDMGILQNISLNDKGIVMTIVSEMIQIFHSGISTNNLSSVLQYDITGGLKAILSQLQTMDWLMLQVAKIQQNFNSSLTGHTMHSIVQWFQDNNQHISLILKDVELMINSFNNFNNLTDMIQVFSMVIQNQQSLIHQIGGELQSFTNMSFIWNLLDKNLQTDAKIAWLLLQKMESVNMSSIITSVDHLQQTIQNIKGLDLGYTFSNNPISEKIFTIIMEGMKILKNIQINGPITKEDIYQMYDFTYLLVQDEQTWVPFHNISTMEAELLDVLYLAMTQFLRGNGSLANSAQDVLQILIQDIVKNTTINGTEEVTTCKWPSIYSSSDANATGNHTLGDLIYLTLQNSPVFHNVCRNGSLAEERACLIQVLRMSMTILAELNNMSGLRESLIQSLNDSLTFICSSLPDHNATQMMTNLEALLFNQSSPVHLLIEFIVQHYNSTFQTSDLQQAWTQISQIIKILVPVDSHIYDLIETAVNLTIQPNWLGSWQNLENIFAMNWTVSTIDLSLSVLETMRRTVVFVDGVMNGEALQIYQAIASFVNNPVFSALLNMATSQQINTTISSADECRDVVNAVANFSSSVWPMLNQTQSSIEEILSNVGLLACDTLYIQSTNDSWILGLEIINNVLSNVAKHIPAELTGYFMATEKIVSFMSGILQSSNISQEKLWNSIYDLLIQQLKIFDKTTFVADWLEKIPVQNITSILFNSGNVSVFDQVLVLETELLQLLSSSLNASTYSQGISILSDSLMNIGNNISSLSGRSGISQQLNNALTTFAVSVPVPSLTEPYGTVMTCVKNVAADLSDHQTGHLDVAIQDLFNQNDVLANGSIVPELLDQKITQLNNLTTVICGLGTSNSTESYCYIPCQYLTVLQRVADVTTPGIKAAQKTQTTQSKSIPMMLLSLLESLYLALEDEVNKIITSALPVSQLSNITAILSNLTNSMNGTITAPKVTLASIFHNTNQVKKELREKVNLSEPSINALMDVEIPSNKTDIGDWFVTLYRCKTNNSLVAEPLQVFCNLPPDKGYQMAIIFLKNVDILQLVYRMLVPSTWQTNIEYIIAALNNLLKSLDELFAKMPSTDELKNLMQIMNLISGSQTRRKRSVDPLASSSSRATTYSITDIARFMCMGNYKAVFKALYLLYPSITQSSSSTTRTSARSQSINQLYGIPTDNAFCSNLFTTLVQTSSGAGTWMLLKPMLYGQILYTPYTPETMQIMNTTATMLSEVEGYKIMFTTLSNDIQLLMDNMNNINQAMKLINLLQGFLNNTVITGFLQDFLQFNTTDLSAKIAAANSYIQFLVQNGPTIASSQSLVQVLENLLSCVAYNRIKPFNSVTQMMVKANELQDTNELFAAVTFHLSGTSRDGRSASGLPKQIKYTISMRSLLSEDTNYLRDSNWVPGPHTAVNKYSRGFVYLQENIDRAIIQMQTNKTLDNVGVQYQPMPFPCYTKNSFLYSMAFSLPIALMISWVLFIAAFVKKLVHEKELRLHEYMKMMGINSGSHFFAWFIECACFLIITVAILVLILKFGKILPNSDGFILFLFFLDYSLTVIAMGYLISVFFNNTNVAALSGSLIYIITFFPFIVVVSKETDLSFAGKTLLSLFSPTALSYATQYIVSYEERNEGMQWKYMYTSPMLDDSFSFGWLCWIMVIDTMIYFIIGWYIRIVFPGKYGIGAPWYFPFLPSFWAECCGLPNVCSKKPSGLMMSNIVAHGITEKKGGDLYPHNEQEPEDLDVGVSLHGLTKIYQAKAAVENLNLNFYEGHITALLGHNGAGKTTTLSMLTGLFSASSGTIYVYGNDIRTHLDLARKSMGVCMQYDVLFDYLTTKEHLLLYGSIKAPQWKKRQLHEEVKRTLKETGLYRHRHKPVKALSGGMRRKLSICIALIGGSKVVILDEPTTGVDPCSRRGIWEVISKNKKDKTIILSTHHLDEAEVLSDRIAFLERGGLKCCGTPRFLKERFGSGYHLTLTKKFPNKKDESICDSEQVTALIQSHIPEASLKEDVGGELVYVLPPFSAEISGAYLSLLRALDTSLDDLHIGCYGISDTTIEEVFLKLTDGLDEDDELNSRAVPISNVDNLIVDDESSTSSYNFFDRDDQPLDRSENITGFKLLLKKIMAMFIKRFHNSKRNWKGLISQILLPVLFVIAAMGLGSLSLGYAVYPELLLTPEMYGTTDQAIVFGLSNDTSDDLMNAMNSFPGIDNACLDQNSQCLAANSLGSWNSTGDQTIAYGNCNCSTGYAMCQMSIPPHRMTYSKQMMYNLTGRNMEGYLMSSAMQFVQKRYGGWSFGIPTSQIISLVPVPDNLTLSKVWYNNEGRHSLPAFLNSFSNFLLRANLPSTDASKYSISVYNAPLPGAVTQGTTTTTLVNTLVALSILVGYSITTASFVTYVVKEYDNGSKRLQHIAGIGEVCYWMTNFLYDLAIYFIPVALSIAMIAAFKLPAFYNFPNLGAVSLLFILFGYATFSWMYLIAGAFKNPGMAFISYVCINLFIGINTIISSSVVYMLLQQTSTTDKDYQSLNNTYSIITNVFKIFPQFCFGYGLITLSQQQTIKDQLQIYGNSDPVDIFGMDILGYMYVAMVVQGTFCFILRLLINDGIIYSVKTFFKKSILKKSYFTIKDPEEDEDVTAERDRVESGNANGDLLLVQGLTKVFHQVHRNMTAVNNMTLGIPPGECFGLLGVNGAGKTTTFKMLTGDTSPSSGNIQIRNHFGSLVNVLGFNKDWSSFGYCPQEDALDELMTGEEHLYYYARIHGIPERRIKHVVNLLLHKLQLVQYKDRITVNYSCGTRRKLSTALALIGKPSILLLDEPSSGMDPKTKRHLWKIISEEVKEKCAVILTSHSMEECEALCTRLAIMVRGKFQCIGSLQHIKSRFGSGFTVKMHLKDSSVSIETITSFMHSHFPNTFLKEHHFTMAEYHVPVSAGGVASIFDLLESNKKDLNIIHFSVSQTTLDEVFINFAQDQASPDNSRESSQGSLQNVAIA